MFIYVLYILSLNWDYYDSNTNKQEFKKYCQPVYKFFPRNGNYNLEKLIVIFRHGDRAPLKNLSKDWEKKKCIRCKFTDGQIYNCNEKNCTKGDLTIKGFNQATKLGKFIKKSYVPLLFPNKLNIEKFNYRVTKIGRTHSTLMGVMKGINNNKTIDQVKKGGDIDSLLKIKECTYLKEKTMVDTKINKDLEEDLNNINIFDEKELSLKADEIRCNMCNNIKNKPDNKNINEQILKLSNNTWSKQMKNVSLDKTSKKIVFGKFSSELIEEMRSDFAISFISAHDGSIAMLLSSLSDTLQEWPPYASAIFIEIWCKHGRQFVRLVYNDKKIEFIESEKEFIPIEVFGRYLIKMSSDDFKIKQLCAQNGNTFNSNFLIDKKLHISKLRWPNMFVQ